MSVTNEGNRYLRLHQVAPASAGYALVLHGGAGSRIEELSLERQGQYAEGLTDAYRAGEDVLGAGGSALDAVCVTVERLENNPLFNSGRGAALTSRGEAELDASVMTGDGRAGAVAASRYAKNPVLLARKVLEESAHVFLVAPGEELLARWGLRIVEPGYFITPQRQEQLERVRSKQVAASRHGTVGAAALDAHGNLAAATSTGGMVNQSMGRVGDTPVIGAGNYARDGVAAISCTGEGEAFIQGVVAHDVAARMRYLGESLRDAVTATIATELDSRGASGGIIAVSADGSLVVGHNSPAMFAAYRKDDHLVTMT
jgi:beta-aspartyl-peptidase (threonine type)